MEKAIGTVTAKAGCGTFLKGGFELAYPLKMSKLYLQCSNSTCRVAYHPLCARVAGFCVECYMKPEDVDRLHFIPFDEDEEDQCIQLLDIFEKIDSNRSNQKVTSESSFKGK